MPVTLSEKARRTLRRLAHERKVVVQTGAAGLTDNVTAEIERALTAHELVKVRLVAADRDARTAMADAICTTTGAALVQRLGHVATLYRPDPEKPRIDLADDT